MSQHTILKILKTVNIMLYTFCHNNNSNNNNNNNNNNTLYESGIAQDLGI